ncbi:GNAT family N-acetyltransferase [Amycolatopsis sp. cmx-4-54]|uniref:GNAT family N-acetyltransferase n=1 Tax=Amycolatopsis sp. cmx-4-54 TaxID=2790936 RepID=UPI00397E5341
MLADHFPLLGLRLTTPRLELRLPSPDDLGALADLAACGVHDADAMPFIVPWTDQAPAEVVLSVVQHHWRQLGNWTPHDWSLDFTVFTGGGVVGQQSISARDLAINREVSTGCWVGQRHQRQGIGTEMRAAALHLAFVGLHADEAISAAFDDNLASRAVSRKLGYQPDGVHRRAVRGRLTVEHRLRLSRARWEQHRTVPVRMERLAPCLPLLGLDDR